GYRFRRSVQFPDTPGMPEPPEKTAWNFMPDDWTFTGNDEDEREDPDHWASPDNFEPVTQLEHARLGNVTGCRTRRPSHARTGTNRSCRGTNDCTG
ncbi:MAG: hypothetical protein ABEJ65_04460, partial [bacterium]